MNYLSLTHTLIVNGTLFNKRLMDGDSMT